MTDRAPATPLETLRHVLASRPAGGPPAVAYDVGAHVGGLARELVASGLFGGVVGFEPRPENAQALAGLEGVSVERTAVGERAGEALLHFDDNTATASLLPFGSGYAHRGAVRTLRVPVIALDDYRERHGAPVALLKVDTQGHDLAVLRGAERLLRGDRPVVMTELIYLPLYDGQSDPARISALLEAAGYALYSLFNLHATVEGRLAFADGLFVPAEWRVPWTQAYVQLDAQESLRTQISILGRICQERLDVINVLDAEVKRLAATRS